MLLDERFYLSTGVSQALEPEDRRVGLQRVYQSQHNRQMLGALQTCDDALALADELLDTGAVADPAVQYREQLALRRFGLFAFDRLGHVAEHDQQPFAGGGGARNGNVSDLDETTALAKQLRQLSQTHIER